MVRTGSDVPCSGGSEVTGSSDVLRRVVWGTRELGLAIGSARARVATILASCADGYPVAISVKVGEPGFLASVVSFCTTGQTCRTSAFLAPWDLARSCPFCRCKESTGANTPCRLVLGAAVLGCDGTHFLRYHSRVTHSANAVGLSNTVVKGPTRSVIRNLKKTNRSTSRSQLRL